MDEKIFIADDNNDYEDLYGGRSNIADDDDDGSARFDSPSLKMSLVRGQCGYPGSPLNGRVLHLLERYEQGMVVTYECDPGYFLLGPMTRTCQSNSTWSGRMPICGMLICFDLFEKLIQKKSNYLIDQSIRNLGLTSASEALNNYPPQLAVDGNFRTCFFSNRRKPRWWRVELPRQVMDDKNQSIISIALTLPPISMDKMFKIVFVVAQI